MIAKNAEASCTDPATYSCAVLKTGDEDQDSLFSIQEMRKFRNRLLQRKMMKYWKSILLMEMMKDGSALLISIR